MISEDNQTPQLPQTAVMRGAFNPLSDNPNVVVYHWHKFIPKDFTELVRKEMRGKMEQKMTIYLARRTNSNYKNFWYELFHFYINPQINKFPKLNV